MLYSYIVEQLLHIEKKVSHYFMDQRMYIVHTPMINVVGFYH